jgi:t-SNARE complex subunit (syntaxin)
MCGYFKQAIQLEDIVWYMETMTKYVQKALNDTAQGIELLNSEVKMMRQAFLPNWMTLDILPVALIKIGYCVYIPDNSAHV